MIHCKMTTVNDSSPLWLIAVLQGTKKAYRKPHFRGNCSADFHDILHPDFDDCSVPLVWWPWWPFNPGDFFLSSLAPFHAMLTSGVIDENIRYTPVMEGLTSPGYFQWYFDPITHFPVSLLYVHCVLVGFLNAHWNTCQPGMTETSLCVSAPAYQGCCNYAVKTEQEKITPLSLAGTCVSG